MKTLQYCLGALLACVLCVGCKHISNDGSPVHWQAYSYAETHMGMVIRMTLYHTNRVEAGLAAEAAFLRVAKLDEIMSDYDPESELNHLCNSPHGTPVPISNDLFRVLETSLELARETDGKFDPTLGPLTKLWRNTRKTKMLPTAEALEAAKAVCGYEKLVLDKKKQTATLLVPGMQLDLGGIGKGFASDEALATLKEHGIQSALVAASGDIAVSNPPPGMPGWLIQVETFTDGMDDPAAGNYVISLANQAISTSGDVIQFVELNGKRYSHILDVETGLGLVERKGATVVHPRATYSDAFATIACILNASETDKIISYKHGDKAAIRLATLLPNGTKQYSVINNFPDALPEEN